MKLRWIACALTIALSLPCAPALAQPDAAQRFRVRVAGVLEVPDGEFEALRDFDPKEMAATWHEMDAIVLSRLRAGHSVATIARFIAALPGARPDDPEAPPGEPGYQVMEVEADVPLVLGVYNLAGRAPGRVSVFARRGHDWQREGVYDAADPVRAYVLGAGAAGARWATIATFTGGDREECRLALWSYTRATLRSEPADTTPMVDCEVEADSAGVRITFHAFPRALQTSVMGVRLSTLRTIGPAGRVRDEPLNPWAHLLNRYYALRSGGERAKAMRLLARPELAPLLADPEYEAVSDEGEAAAGRGSVLVVRTRDGVQHWTRITMLRTGGVWRIATYENTAAPGGDRPETGG